MTAQPDAGGTCQQFGSLGAIIERLGRLLIQSRIDRQDQAARRASAIVPGVRSCQRSGAA